MSAVDQRIKEHLREREGVPASRPRRVERMDASERPAPVAVPSGGGRAVRVGSNLMILVGVLILLYVVGYQGYYLWLENSTPKNIVMVGVPTTTYLSNDALTVATATPAPGGRDVADPTPARVGSGPNVVNASLPLPNLDPAAPVAPAAAAAAPTSRARRVVAPAINLDAPIIDVGWHTGKDKKTGKDVAIWEVAEYAAGHHNGSANPGSVGNIVISGHDDWKGEVFRYLEKLNLGNEITVYNEDGTAYLYVVVQMERVKEENVPLEDRIKNAEYMNQTPDQTLTLITCWPYKVDTHRLIVIAKPYDVIKQAAVPQNGATGPTLR